MRTLEEVFIKEFKAKRANSNTVSLFNLGLKDASIGRVTMFQVSGIEVDYFKELNDTNVMLIPSGTKLEKRRFNSKGEPIKKSSGGYMSYDYSLPKGSRAVYSKVNIKLPSSFKETGYDYVDYVDKGNTRYFIYVLPKTVIYRLYNTALALSTKKLSGYSTLKLNTWNAGVLYLCVIPYKGGRKYQATIVLQVSYGLDYSIKTKEVLEKLITDGVMSPYDLYETEEKGNLGYEQIDSPLNVIDYVLKDIMSLAEISENDIEAILES